MRACRVKIDQTVGLRITRGSPSGRVNASVTRAGSVPCPYVRGIAPSARLKDIIVRGVEDIYSKESEDLLSEHPAVAEAVGVAALLK
jgi:acyl-CoA synthetase (AMP-forming)/AMP-acid ligase II